MLLTRSDGFSFCRNSKELPDSQVVWSTGAKSLIVWDAYTGVYLGSVSRASDAELDKRQYVEHSERDERYAPRMHIDHRKVRARHSSSRFTCLCIPPPFAPWFCDGTFIIGGKGYKLKHHKDCEIMVLIVKSSQMHGSGLP